MTRFVVKDGQMPVGRLLNAARKRRLVVERDGQARCAVLPLTDDVLDFLLETDPGFIADCQRIRQEMAAGKRHSLVEVEAMFGLNAPKEVKIRRGKARRRAP